MSALPHDWKPGRFEIATAKDERRSVNGWINGRFGIQTLTVETSAGKVELFKPTHLPSGGQVAYAEELCDADAMCAIADELIPPSLTEIGHLLPAQWKALGQLMNRSLHELGFRQSGVTLDGGPLLHNTEAKPRSRRLLRAAARHWWDTHQEQRWANEGPIRAQVSAAICEAYPVLTAGREPSIEKIADQAFKEMLVDIARDELLDQRFAELGITRAEFRAKAKYEFAKAGGNNRHALEKVRAWVTELGGKEAT
jgi:hypothetical protein